MMEDETTTVMQSDDTTEWAVGPEDVRIWEDAFHLLHISVGDTTHDDVRPRRVFPLSGKSPFVSFLNDKSEELVLLTNPNGLDAESKTVLDKVLRLLYFSAIITRVDSVTEAMGVSLWHVVTNRGYAKFEVVDRQRHIRVLPPGRFLITDADGNRFEIPCIHDLDEQSQRLVETET